MAASFSADTRAAVGYTAPSDGVGCRGEPLKIMNVITPKKYRRRRTAIPALVAALPLLIASLVSAQTAGDSPRGPHGRGHRGPGGPGHGPAHAVVRVLDADRDQTISTAELLNAAISLRALDTNGDGAVTADELRPARPADASASGGERPQRPAGVERPHPFNPVMFALDADEDGALSAAEITNATASLQALDLDGDGQLTFDEFCPLPPEGARSRKGPRSAQG